MNETTDFVYCVHDRTCVCVCVRACVCTAFSIINVWQSGTVFVISHRIRTSGMLVNGHTFI